MNRVFLVVMLSIGIQLLSNPAIAKAYIEGKSVSVLDAESGSWTLKKGRKLELRCTYKYADCYELLTPWRVRFQVDGKTVATQDGAPPECSGAAWSYPEEQHVSATWTASSAGHHEASCMLDVDGALKAAGKSLYKQDLTHNFEVDVTSVLGKPGSDGPSVLKPSAATLAAARHGSGQEARGPMMANPAPVIALPDLTFALRAQPVPNCGNGQDVVLVSGTVKNVGAGYAQIPPGKPIVRIDSAVGVYGGSITLGNLSPGQSQPVSVNLKAKGSAASLAGATLKLNAWLNYNQEAIKESNYAGNYLVLKVSFPANFCQQHRATAPPVQTEPGAGRTRAPQTQAPTRR